MRCSKLMAAPAPLQWESKLEMEWNGPSSRAHTLLPVVQPPLWLWWVMEMVRQDSWGEINMEKRLMAVSSLESRSSLLPVVQQPLWLW